MAGHAKPIRMWWLVTLTAVTMAVIAVVLVLQADSGEATSPRPTDPPSATSPRPTDPPSATSSVLG
ncbi:hypothetical protein [Streptomyces sp. TLI_185]|uniref:hypothetical protein n=1 Tax=Streptomyces sp. TLI_185 TaxID=2485151 RepID=UPI000F4EEFC7|nr:hypothetical protein [Streptomyces sp. TLI_185]RPF33269.1 hypothetical protein EDD92_3176 [Streptomyces sp. TLI_185]